MLWPNDIQPGEFGNTQNRDNFTHTLPPAKPHPSHPQLRPGATAVQTSCCPSAVIPPLFQMTSSNIKDTASCQNQVHIFIYGTMTAEERLMQTHKQTEGRKERPLGCLPPDSSFLQKQGLK